MKPSKVDQHASDPVEASSEIHKLRAQLRRTDEGREIFKNAAAYFAREPR